MSNAATDTKNESDTLEALTLFEIFTTNYQHKVDKLNKNDILVLLALIRYLYDNMPINNENHEYDVLSPPHIKQHMFNTLGFAPETTSESLARLVSAGIVCVHFPQEDIDLHQLKADISRFC